MDFSSIPSKTGKTEETPCSKISFHSVIQTDSDDVLATLDYFKDEASYIVGMADEITVTALDNTLLRHRTASIEPTTGNTRQIHQTVGSKVATTKLNYDTAGNLTRIESPPGENTTAYSRSYLYDVDKLNSQVVQISDSLGYISTVDEIDYRYGQPITTTDVNGNKSIYHYDQVGRVSEIYGPNEIDSSTGNIISQTPTIAFEYYPKASDDPYAITHHIDPYREGSDTIDTVLIIDGMKRVLQTKKDASLYQENNTARDGRIISGRVVFDELGRVKEQYYPREDYTQPASKFIEDFDSVTPTTMDYDAMGRVTLVTLPDLTTTSTDYGLAKDRDELKQFQTIITDANTNRKESYRDTNKRITAVKEYMDSEEGDIPLWTSYQYDALGQIKQVKDAKNKLTTVGYDQLGRRTSIDNLDTGLTQMRYDLTGNLVEKITANLVGDADKPERPIIYRYRQTLLTDIEYPDNPQNDVSYTYGEAGASHNRAGRITTVKHSVGTEERFYGKLGETLRDIKTYQVGPQTEVFDTRYEYDSFGRLQQLTLPDGEVLDYDYDAGGSLNRIHGLRPDKAAPHSVDQVYLQSLLYDKFGQRAYMLQGNGITTRYQYDARTRRLDNLTAKRKGSIIFQNLDYGYDAVGNINTLNNQVAVTAANVFGGPVNQTFTYDKLNRLKTGEGDFEYRQGRFHKYTLGMAYDEIHNITQKTQRHTLVFGDKEREQRGTTYDWAYDYQGSQPHAPTHIGNRTFSYDANGNQTGWDNDDNGTKRTIVWDEENRVQAIQDPKNTLRFSYDDQGGRIIKTGQHGTTVYVNQYYTVRNGATVSKHIFAGSSRIATHFRYGGQNRTDLSQTDSTAANTNTTNNGQGKDEPPGLLKRIADTVTETFDSLFGDDSNNHPGQGLEHRSDRANEVARNTEKNKHLNGGVPGGEHGKGNGRGNNGNANPGNDNGNNGNTDPGNGNNNGGNNTGNNGNGQGGLGGTQAEEFLYYYHPDHLGSTSYVTDEDAAVYEHIAYFPHGETWVQQATNSQRIQYKYTSKELDTETGLYYYGARYYDPRTSVWQSTDPILGMYLPNGNKEQDKNLPGIGGVFNSLNLGLYTYSHQNSIRLIDPDGNAPEDTAGIRLSSPPSLLRLTTFEALRRDTSIDQAVEIGRGFREVTAPVLMAVEAGPLLLAGAVEATPVVAKVIVENAETIAQVAGLAASFSGIESRLPPTSAEMDPATHVERARENKPKSKSTIAAKIISIIISTIAVSELPPDQE